jgi:hypothetical protein
LKPDTTEENMISYLADAVIKHAFHRKLNEKAGRFKIAAFALLVMKNSRKYYTKSLFGELRQWVFRPHTEAASVSILIV